MLTRRTDTVDDHKGQISFPGGRRDPGEDLVTTALREAWEEVGIDPAHVEVIGRLDEETTRSNYRIAPFVGVLPADLSPYPFMPSAEEVAEVLAVPLRHLTRPEIRERDERVGPDGAVAYSPAFLFGEHRIWGATARMLDRFLELMLSEEMAQASAEER